MGSLPAKLGALAAVVLIATSISIPLAGQQSGRASALARAASAPAVSSTATPSPSPTATATATVQPTATPRAATPTPTIVVPVPPPGTKARPDPIPSVRGPAVGLPRQIRIPSIGVDAEFEVVGLAADGSMDVPKDANRVAWYSLGPRPGEPGNAIAAGHVDWGGKAAVFWGLKELQSGDQVEVVAADERQYQFVVKWARWYDASGAPVSDLFRQSDSTELTLITCGGSFDRASRQYLSRLVVRAALR